MKILRSIALTKVGSDFYGFFALFIDFFICMIVDDLHDFPMIFDDFHDFRWFTGWFRDLHDLQDDFVIFGRRVTWFTGVISPSCRIYNSKFKLWWNFLCLHFVSHCLDFYDSLRNIFQCFFFFFSKDAFQLNFLIDFLK